MKLEVGCYSGRTADERTVRFLLDLTAQVHIDWEYYLKWYNDRGWVGDEARRLGLSLIHI